MNYSIMHNNHSNPFESPKMSKDINANVVVDERLKSRTRNGGYVAWPRQPQKETGSDAKMLYKVFGWLKTFKTKSNNSFAS